MNILITAGNTQIPLDRVRAITNIFTGKTGGHIAACAHQRGHTVTLLTSHPEAVPGPWNVRTYRTFDELEALLAEEVPHNKYDSIIHTAAVSDYRVIGTFTPESDGSMRDVSAGKVKSTYPELWLKLTPTPKLIDRFRARWGFRGILVKFKLEVDVTEAELLIIAERSRLQSSADLMVANAYDGTVATAYLGAETYTRVSREELPERLLDAIATLGLERALVVR